MASSKAAFHHKLKKAETKNCFSQNVRCRQSSEEFAAGVSDETKKQIMNCL